MNRRRRTEILIRSSDNLAARFAEEIVRRYQVREIERPNNGLVMLKIRESAQNSLFNIGEVLVTESKVQINGHLGIGITIDNNPELAYNLAIVDAAYNAQLPETPEWNEILIKEEIKNNQREEVNNRKILKTKVSFETMDV